MTEKIEAVEECYTKRQIMEKLKVSATTYHKICKLGLLQSFRLYPGGPKRHSPQQLTDYLQGRIVQSNGSIQSSRRRA